MSRTTPNSRNIIPDVETNIQTHVSPSVFDVRLVSKSGRQFFPLPTGEGGRNTKEPIEHEKENAALLTACAPLEDEDRETPGNGNGFENSSLELAQSSSA